jgi:hypothetical protein
LRQQFCKHHNYLLAIAVLKIQYQSASDAFIRNSHYYCTALGLRHCKQLCLAFDAQYASDAATRFAPLSEQH